jgi:hypothetical protein
MFGKTFNFVASVVILSKAIDNSPLFGIKISSNYEPPVQNRKYVNRASPILEAAIWKL